MNDGGRRLIAGSADIARHRRHRKDNTHHGDTEKGKAIGVRILEVIHSETRAKLG
jgi:hypothetical protein